MPSERTTPRDERAVALSELMFPGRQIADLSARDWQAVYARLDTGGPDDNREEGQ